jgi:hypothetical protein
LFFEKWFRVLDDGILYSTTTCLKKNNCEENDLPILSFVNVDSQVQLLPHKEQLPMATYIM